MRPSFVGTDGATFGASTPGMLSGTVVRDGRNRGATVVRGRDDERLGTNICYVSIRV